MPELCARTTRRYRRSSGRQHQHQRGKSRTHRSRTHARCSESPSDDSLDWRARARISALNRTYLPFQSVKRHWYLGCNESTSSRAKGRSCPGFKVSLQVDLLKSNPRSSVNQGLWIFRSGFCLLLGGSWTSPKPRDTPVAYVCAECLSFCVHTKLGLRRR